MEQPLDDPRGSQGVIGRDAEGKDEAIRDGVQWCGCVERMLLRGERILVGRV